MYKKNIIISNKWCNNIITFFILLFIKYYFIFMLNQQKQTDEFQKRLFFNKYRPDKKLGEDSLNIFSY